MKLKKILKGFEGWRKIFNPRITPVLVGERLKVISAQKGSVNIADIRTQHVPKPNTCIVGRKSRLDNGENRAVKKGYYLAHCVDVVELADNETLLLIFEPYDQEGNCYTWLSLTLPKRIGRSEALGEFLFTLEGELEGAHATSELVIENASVFRDLVQGKEFGIEVSVNLDTGWLYVTDFFNLCDTHDLPTCPDDIIRNVF